MKSFFTGILMLMFMFAQADVISKDELREIKGLMYRAVESSSLTDSLYNKLIAKKSKNAMIIAYTGTLEALKAKHAWNPYQKLKYVTLSNKTMRSAVKAAPDNLEIRFMRFTIQHYTPSFLGLSSNINEDKNVIVKHYKTENLIKDHSLIEGIAKFMIQSKRCSTTEEKIFQKYV